MLAGPAAAAVQTILPYDDTHHVYKEVALGAEPGFEQPNYNATGFLTNGVAPWGAAGFCGYTFNTTWTENTDILLRRTIFLPPGTGLVTVRAAIDNTIQVWLNGTDISGGPQSPGGCTFQNHVVFEVPDGVAVEGSNLLAVRATGAAAPNLFDIQVRADIETIPPQTSILTAPVSTADTTPAFVFSSSEPGSTFQCRIDQAPFAPCTSPFEPGPLALGTHVFEVRAIDPAANIDATPAKTTFSVVSPPATPKLPRPVLGRTVNAEPVTGTVFVSVPAGAARAAASVPGLKGRTFIPLAEARNLPVGTFFDTRRGAVRLTSARDAAGTTQTGEFSAGVFQTLQPLKRGAKGLTELRMKGGSFAGCSAGKKASASRSKRRIRRLRGNAKGRFRTRGRNSAATVRGTDWTVTDRCDGTLTQVRRGRVEVRDYRRRKTILVKAGKRYLARARPAASRR